MPYNSYMMIEKEDSMFEEKVMALAKVVFPKDVELSFVSGTLFAEGCDAKDAVRMETATLSLFPVGIVLSRFGNTSAFDFV